MKRRRLVPALLCGILALSAGSGAAVYAESSAESVTSAESGAEAVSEGGLIVENGMLQPMCTFSNLRDPAYTNEGSDILRYCVYVETDHDTDLDGRADLVKALVEVPRAAAEGVYKAATIYDPTPYGAGTVDEFEQGGQEKLYTEKPFDYDLLYRECEKRTPEGEIGTLEAAEQADPTEWNCTTPGTGHMSFGYVSDYDYYLVRGFAVVIASGIGTFGSEGFELCGMDLERDSHKCVVEWLAGNRKAYTDRVSNIEIKADWSNGNVAMTGTSYGGTLPYEVATTGVEGLKTIIPMAGIASWYDYTNSQGVSIINSVNYADGLAAFNCGGVFLDDDWTVINEDYGSWLWQISRDQEATNGDYAPIWATSDYSDDYEKINCSAMIVHGLNDFNVTTKQADLMYRAFKKADKPVKMVLHQDGHNSIYDFMIGDESGYELINKWLSHYLYGVDNGIENMAEVTVQSNVDGSYREYDSWSDSDYLSVKPSGVGETSEVSSVGLAEVVTAYTGEGENLTTDDRDEYYRTLDKRYSAVYDLDIPENTTIAGVPEVHVRLATEQADLDGLMITAVLADESEDGEAFKAFLLKSQLSDRVPKTTVDYVDLGGGQGYAALHEYVQSPTEGKCFTFGWTDLQNPGHGYDSSEYTVSEAIEGGKYYDYTFYMLPTVYTVAPGHKLKLILTTWDPYRVFLDEGFNLDMSLTERIEKYSYGFISDNTALEVRLPVKE